MLSILSCASWPFVCPFWKNIFSGSLPIFKMIFIYLAVLVLLCSTGFSLVAVSRGCSSLLWTGFALWWCLLAEIGSRALRLQQLCFSALEHRLKCCDAQANCSLICGIVLTQASNSCLLHWQADSLLLSHQGSPSPHFLNLFFLMLSCMSSLYILDIKPLSDVSFANIFYYSVGGLYIFFIVSLSVQKLLV